MNERKEGRKILKQREDISLQWIWDLKDEGDERRDKPDQMLEIEKRINHNINKIK
jgi:hypothetical protein